MSELWIEMLRTDYCRHPVGVGRIPHLMLLETVDSPEALSSEAQSDMPNYDRIWPHNHVAISVRGDW